MEVVQVLALLADNGKYFQMLMQQGLKERGF